MGLIVDLFCGGGGAGEGIYQATGRHPDIAVDFDKKALAMHAANHPGRHYLADVWDVDPRSACQGQPVDLLWLSPSCTQFSKARQQGKPLDADIRDLAWIMGHWATQVRPPLIILENVAEFQKWGPLSPTGQPDASRVGETFRTFLGFLRGLGYRVDFRELRACDYGAPTTRKRLFLIARCDGLPIVWPEPTHGPGRLPYRSAAECIDWTIPVPSIFGRAKPLVDATMRRIVRALAVHVFGGKPYLVPSLGAAAGLIQIGYGEHVTQKPRILDIHQPLGTLVTSTKHAVVTAVLVRHYAGNGNGGSGGHLLEPTHTLTCKDHHALVTATMSPDRAVLLEGGPTLNLGGELYGLADVGMRPLRPREQFSAQGFGAYDIAPVVDGSRLSDADQTHMCGNSVSPPMARALVSANLEGCRKLSLPETGMPNFVTHKSPLEMAPAFQALDG